MPFSNILFPVDFSERCRAVAPSVESVVKRHKASLTLLHLVGKPTIDDAAKRLECFAMENFPGLKPELIVDTGDPGSCIVEIAETSGADLIMMPTCGLGRFPSASLGSVTAKVLHHAECAVWTAAEPDETMAYMSPDWRTVVCGIDTSADATRLIRFAADLQSSSGASIELVHALPPPPFLEESASQLIERMQTAAGVIFPVCMEAGKVPEVIASAARDLYADLVLIGRGALPHVAGKPISNVHAIVRDVQCPVLSV